MADLIDVLDALAALITSVVYPNGSSAPSVITTPVRIYPGWPIATQLNADLRGVDQNGNPCPASVNISIFAPPGGERNTTRYPREWIQLTPGATTLTASIDETGTIVTLGGTVSTPQNVALIFANTAFPYAVRENDTLSTIAAALAALVATFTPATAVGPAITIPAAVGLKARVGGVGTVLKEVSRQDRLIQITVWSPTPRQRDQLVKLFDPVLRETNFLGLADGTGGRLIYRHGFLDDAIQKAGCFRRDLCYSVEYPTTITAPAPQAIVVATELQGGGGPTSDFTPTEPPPVVFES